LPSDVRRDQNRRAGDGIAGRRRFRAVSSTGVVTAFQTPPPLFYHRRERKIFRLISEYTFGYFKK